MRIDGELRIGTSGTTQGTLLASNTQTISGSGTIVFGNNGANTLGTSSGTITLTLGPDLVLRGNKGRFTASSVGNIVLNGTLRTDVSTGAFTVNTSISSFTNAGRIEPINGSSITINSTSFSNTGTMIGSATNTIVIAPTTFTNSNLIQTTGGSLTLGGTGTWSNTGTINVADTAVRLGGQFTQFAMGSATPVTGQGTFIRSGGTVNLSGTLTGDLTLNNVTGQWSFGNFGGSNGTIRNGTITSTSEFASTSTFIFDNVTIASGTFVRLNSTVTSSSNLTINGELRLGEDSSSGSIGVLQLSATQTIGGNGTIVMGGRPSGNSISISVSNVTVTIGPNIKVRGASGSFSSSIFGNTTIINQGLIQPDVNGGVFGINDPLTSFVNAGRFEPINNTTIRITTPNFTNSSSLKATGGNVINVLPTTFTNFTSAITTGNATSVTLTGGSYEVDATSTLRLYPGSNAGRLFRVNQLAADVKLVGAGAMIVSSELATTYDAFRDLSSISATGSLSLQGGSFFDPIGNFNNAGVIQVDASSRFGSKTSGPLVTSGLVSNYAAENNANDGTGTNHGTLQNGATFGTGIVGQAFSLDGVDDFVTIPDSTSLRPASFTLEAWFQFSATPSGIDVLFSKPSTSGSDVSYAISYDANAAWLQLDYNTTAATTPFRPAVGVWYHIATTCLTMQLIQFASTSMALNEPHHH